MSTAPSANDTHRTLVQRLLAERTAAGHWVGELSSSALSTATAAIALLLSRQGDRDRALAEYGLRWLTTHQNADGGWGDTTDSVSNISTTALCWAALSLAPSAVADAVQAVAKCEAWLIAAAGGLRPEQLKEAIASRYGNDRTFSAPILTTLALCGRLGPDGWRHVPQLPFELAACPPQWFQWLQLPVVSYALPALIAIGQLRHHHRRTPGLGMVRDAVHARTRMVLRRIQPATGGYLEATPLTSFVVMSLAGMGDSGDEVVQEGLRFLRASARRDGSWPIDTNLATWVTTLSVNALAAAPEGHRALPESERRTLTRWLLAQQYRAVHPYTQAAPGGWAWTPLPGGVPDADDTAGALLALRHLGLYDPDVVDAASAGIRWLLDLQNRDGGMPTFCRGWGTLPFDRSTPDLTAHALLAWRAWRADLAPDLAQRVDAASPRALTYLRGAQRYDGAWLPLWFGNQRAPDDVNATYGTAKVVLALSLGTSDTGEAQSMMARGVAWLLAAQNTDGGWGGERAVPSSIEETAFAVEALAAVMAADADITAPARNAIQNGVSWLAAVTAGGTTTPPTPVGLYFAKLWYFERLYPLIYATAALGRASASLGEQKAAAE